MQTIDKFNFAGKKAFVRVDFNVPLDENFNITDDTRMRAALPTLKKILADGGSIIIGSHLGRPKGVADKFSLKHIIKHLSELLGVEVQFANDCMGEEAAVKAAALQPGEVLLLENLRFYAEEEGKPRGLAEDATDEEKAAAKKAVKESQKEFTKKLASYADCYVNDAFGTAHRAHASTALIAKYFDTDNKMFGYLMEKEVKAVDKVLNDIQRPFTAIMGGSKVSSKIEIIENLLNKVDNNFNFAGKKAFVRVDFNVPLDENFNITDDTRIRAALPTLKKILADGGSIIIGSHLGRPKGVADKFSLKHIVKHVSELLGVEVQFANDCMGEEAAVKAAALQPGEVLLLENLRFYAEEEGKPRGLAEDATDEEKAAAKKAVKESQKEFTKKLASYADCYVNDAFGTAHRAHASTALIAKYFDVNNKMFGYLMEKEVKAVDKVLNDIKRPFTAIMGGSKVSSKIEIIENLLSKVDNLIIAGGMTYTFTKAMGGKIGISICEDDKLDLALDLMKKAKEKGVNLVLAVDAKIADAFSNDANTKFCAVDEIPDGWEGLDIGPKTEEIFANVIKESKTILWNGPTGVFEFDNFTHGSRAVGEAIVEATKNGAFSLVGGGDSVACVNKFGLASGVSYVSTGGGALLEAIEGKVLPGIAAIQE